MRSIEEPATGKTADSHTYTAHVDCQKNPGVSCKLNAIGNIEEA